MKKKKKKYNSNIKIPPFARVLNKKIDRIKQLEKKYWDDINRQRNVFSNIDQSFEADFRKMFPEQSSLIYACIDGVVLIRVSDFIEKGNVEVHYINSRLKYLLKELPIPYQGKFINFSTIAHLGPNSTFQVKKLTLNEDIVINNLYITVLKYTDDEKLLEIEDAISDIQLSLMGLNSGIFEVNQYLPKEDLKGEKLISRLNSILVEFESLLENAEKEEELQIYIKEHPILLQPYSKVFPKQKLGEDFITDFVLTNTLSQGTIYTFVEIERVSMPIFTKGGEFTADFKHTEKQTLDWDLWLEKNKSYLKEKLIGLESPEFIIVAGRSNDFVEGQNALLRAWNRRQNNLKFYTYDDLLKKLKELISNLEAENNTI
jgi:hypothetical protein